MGGVWSGIWDGVKGAVSDAWNFIQPIISMIQGAVSTVSSAVSSISSMASSVGGGLSSVGKFLGFDEGGFVPGAPGAPMLAWVHGGEYVVSNDMQAGRSKVDNRVLSSGAFMGSGRPSGSVMTPIGPAGASGGTTVIETHTHVHLDGKQISETVQRQMLQLGARRGAAWQNNKR